MATIHTRAAACRRSLIVNVALISALALCALADVPPAQKQALVDLYKATRGAKWTTPWNLATDPCVGAWSGVFCDGQLATITALVLGGQGLAGSVPSSLGSLTDIRQLDLGWNSLVGTIPPSLAKLTKLTSLQLQNNAFTGPLPDAFGDLVLLESLTAHANALTGTIPASLSKLTQIQTLYLYSNKLTGSIPSALTSLPMQYFDVSDNSLTGTVPSGFSVMQFDVSYNQLSGDVPQYAFNPDLPNYVLVFKNNTLSGDGSPSIMSMLQQCIIINMDLSNNDFSTSSPLYTACNAYQSRCASHNPNFAGYCWTTSVPAEQE